MGMFFTWHSSEHSAHLDVKWKPQDEIRGADNTVERRNGESFEAAHSHCQSPVHPSNQGESLLGFRVAVG